MRGCHIGIICVREEINVYDRDFSEEVFLVSPIILNAYPRFSVHGF